MMTAVMMMPATMVGGLSSLLFPGPVVDDEIQKNILCELWFMIWNFLLQRMYVHTIRTYLLQLPARCFLRQQGGNDQIVSLLSNGATVRL